MQENVGKAGFYKDYWSGTSKEEDYIREKIVWRDFFNEWTLKTYYNKFIKE